MNWELGDVELYNEYMEFIRRKIEGDLLEGGIDTTGFKVIEPQRQDGATWWWRFIIDDLGKCLFVESDGSGYKCGLMPTPSYETWFLWRSRDEKLNKLI